MDQNILDFIKENRVSAFTTLLKDGSPHSAALHYSHIDDPIKFYISTANNSMKCENLLDGKESSASMVIGFSEEDWKTLQMDGNVRVLLEEKEILEAQKIHYAVHPNSEKFKDDPATIFLEFTPTWWRFS